MDTSGKAAVTSTGIMGPLLALVVLGINKWVFKGAEVITDADITSLIDYGATLFGLLSGMWGRIRAKKEITTVLPVAK